MPTIEEQSQLINISGIARRIKRELQDMKKLGIIIDDTDVTITKYNEPDYYVYIKNNIDGRLYKFIIPPNYPFTAPRLEINYKPYAYYLRFQSSKFQDLFYKYKGRKCFCCDSLLCANNWGPQITLNMVLKEFDLEQRVF